MLEFERFAIQNLFANSGGNPAFKLEDKHLAAQTSLHVTIEDVRQGVGGDDFINGRIVEILLDFLR